METWLIVLIVLLVFFLVICPAILFTYAGLKFTNNMKKSDINPNDFSSQKMDINFYINGPVRPLAKVGIEYMKTLEVEEFDIDSYDGLKLHGYYYKNPFKKTDRYFIGMHGFKSIGKNEYAPYIKKYFELGFNVLIPDERAHGKSEGKYLTMGVRERYDVQSWANFVSTHFENVEKILIQGISMGGASVCLASNLELPKEVVGIIADCPFDSVKSEITHVMSSNFKMPSFPLVNILNLFAKARVHIDINSADGIASVKEAKVPILFFHGKKDQMVPYECSERLYEACGSKKKLVITDEANHAESMACNKDNYFNTIVEFFEL